MKLITPTFNTIQVEMYRQSQKKRSSDISILDLGSGMGCEALPLLNLGYNVTCVDLPGENSRIDHFRNSLNENGLSCDLVLQDMREYVKECNLEFDIVLSCMSMFFSKNDREKLIEQVKEFTLNGGLNIYTIPTDEKYSQDFIKEPYLSENNFEEFRSQYTNWMEEYIQSDVYDLRKDERESLQSVLHYIVKKT